MPFLSSFSYRSSTSVERLFLTDTIGLRTAHNYRKIKKEWQDRKAEVLARRNKLNAQLESLTLKHPGWQATPFAQKFHEMAAWISSLNIALINLDSLEKSKQIYSLKDTALVDAGETLTRCIIIGADTVIEFLICSTASFVHETTHGGQFESGRIAYFRASRASAANDLYDERDAYRAQYAFDPDYFSKYTSTSPISSINAITVVWVQNLVNSDSCRPYDTCTTCISIHGAPCKPANIGLTNVTITSSKAQLKQAYPKAVKDLDKRPENYMLKTDPNIYIAPACRH